MKGLRILIIAVLLLQYLPGSSQKAAHWIEMGDAAMDKQEYANAAYCFEQAMLLDSASFDLNVKFAQSLRLSKDYARAEYYYQKAYTKDLGRLFPEGQFWLAMMQKQNGDYKEALRNFKKFRTKAKKDKEGYFFRKCETEIDACTFVLNQRLDSAGLQVSRLHEPINSKNADFAAFAGPDQLLYFASTREHKAIELPYETALLFKASLDGLLPASVEPVAASGKPVVSVEQAGAELNAALLQGSPSFSTDGSRLFFTRCEDSSNCELWMADFIDGKASNARKVEKINAPGCVNTMPMLASIEGTEVLFFASNRQGGEGGMDIWWSQLDRNGFNVPVNAGPEVNSPDNELSPFWMNGSLYFSSEWHPGFGGYDIFRSEGSPRFFKAPVNLGFPFNTQANDLYYSYFPELKTGFLSSNRPGSYAKEGERCCNDIYRFFYTDSLESEKPYADLEELNRYLPVTLYFHNDEPGPKTRDTLTRLTYEESYLSYKKLYDTYVRENTKGLSGEARENAEYDVEDFFNLKVDKGMNDLKVFTGLLLKELQKGSDVELAVKGFASPRAKSDYNLNLTRRRISSLENYLRQAENGAFIAYLEQRSPDGGTLNIVQIPYGEYKADQKVSDELGNEKESIYSRSASLERKIEIQSVQRSAGDSTAVSLSAPVRSFDFGALSPDAEVTCTFPLKNTGKSTLVLHGVETECGCTAAEPDKTELLPGEETVLRVKYSPEGRRGIQARSIRLFVEGMEEPVVFTVTADIEQD